MRRLPEAIYLTLKGKWRKLVHDSGGTLHAAAVTRGSESRISEYGAPNHMDRFPAIDQVADLEQDCGLPIITAALADLHGFDLVRRDEATKAIGIHAHFARIIRETRDVELQMAEAMADGSVTDQERAQIIHECQEAITALQALVAELRSRGLKVVAAQ